MRFINAIAIALVAFASNQVLAFDLEDNSLFARNDHQHRPWGSRTPRAVTLETRDRHPHITIGGHRAGPPPAPVPVLAPPHPAPAPGAPGVRIGSHRPRSLHKRTIGLEDGLKKYGPNGKDKGKVCHMGGQHCDLAACRNAGASCVYLGGQCNRVPNFTHGSAGDIACIGCTCA